MVDLTNIDLNSEGVSGFLSSAGDVSVTIAFILIAVVFFGVLAWFFYREMQYKIPITLHRVVGDSQIIQSKDRARINKKLGEIWLKKVKVKQAIPDPKFFVKTLKSWTLYGRWDGNKAIQWQKLAYNSPLSFEPDTYDVYNQMAWRIRNSEVRHMDQSFFDKFGNQIMMMTTVLVIAVVLIVLFDKVGDIGPALRDGLVQWAKTIETVNIQRVS